MLLTIVGCSGSASGPDSAASCYLIQAPYADGMFSLLLDLGPGAFGALHRHLPPEQVDAIGLSHLHPDHCLDLCAFYVAATYSPTAPWPRIPVFGPRGTAERIARAYEVTPGDSEIGTRFDYRDWAPIQLVGPFEVATVRVRHPVEAYAIKVSETATGATLTYSGDTGPCDALVELARGSDLLLIEAAFVDGPDLPPDLHLTPAQAAEVAVAAEVGQALLTHVPPWFDADASVAAAARHVGGALDAARPGAQWTVAAGSGDRRRWSWSTPPQQHAVPSPPEFGS